MLVKNNEPNGGSDFKLSFDFVVISILKNYCAKKDIRNDVLHQVDLVANAIPGVDELTFITQRNSKIAIIQLLDFE